MNDPMVTATQEWLNDTYGADARFQRVTVDGKTGWPVIYALLKALQIELGIQDTSTAFGPTTQRLFTERFPNGVKQQHPDDSSTSNVYSIIQGALWCKGYSTKSNITQNFYSGTGNAVSELKSDMGLTDTTSTVDLEIMQALLSMSQYKLLLQYGGKERIRQAQQEINRTFRAYTGIVPCDGLFARELNKALIQVLQALQGFTPSQATGNFGAGTRSRLKTIDAMNAATHPDWVWLGTLAMLCNGYGENPVRVWDPSIGPVIGQFQSDHALPATQVLDPTTWMSLLTSKGNPDRAAIACDTRFEITDELLGYLKTDGYQVVGRYLCEPGQVLKLPSAYFKAVRPGELERITEGGMQFFPIYQEYSTKLEHFTPADGVRHANEARRYATHLGVPPTYIYFAVDFDAIDAQVTSHIIPYFKAVRANLGGGYRVGIYGARNVCTRVIEAGAAGSAFVSDMSTGFSGNLGFPMPKQWNYDQFHEIKGYRGKWDLDKVAYSVLHSAVSYVKFPEAVGAEIPNEDTNYETLSPLDLIWHLEKRFEELREEGRVGKDPLPDLGEGVPSWVPIPSWRCILNYLSKAYLSEDGTGGIQWAITAEPYRSWDANVLENDSIAADIIKALDRYIGPQRQTMRDRAGGEVDLAHLAVTTISYITDSVVPDPWAGWAGDLVSALPNLERIVRWNPEITPGATLDYVADALVGQDDGYRQHPALSGLQLDSDAERVSNTCNLSDLCSDGDAIALSRALANEPALPHHLSETMRSYYTSTQSLANRFKEIPWSVGATEPEGALEALLTYTADPNLQLLLAKTIAEPTHTLAMTQALVRFIFS